DAPADLAKSEWNLLHEGDKAIVEMEVAGLLLRRSVRISTDPARPWDVEVECTIRNELAAPGVTKAFEIVGPVLPKPTIPDDAVLIAEAGPESTVTQISPADIQKQLAEN